MNINDSFPSKYLRPHDLGTHAPIVVIRAVEMTKMRVNGGAEMKKLVVYFVGKDKGFVLNKTNATTIAKLLGSEETEAWRGRTIRLFATTAKYGNEVVACIRVRAVGEKATVLPMTGRASA